MADFKQLLARCENLADDGELRSALALTVHAEKECESEQDLVALNELRKQIRDELGLGPKEI